ncbi:MAG TPA: hypothetical protein PK263_01760 [bacterium]|nr:hypothetical protein [bacterium]
MRNSNGEIIPNGFEEVGLNWPDNLIAVVLIRGATDAGLINQTWTYVQRLVCPSWVNLPGAITGFQFTRVRVDSRFLSEKARLKIRRREKIRGEKSKPLHVFTGPAALAGKDAFVKTGDLLLFVERGKKAELSKELSEWLLEQLS